MSDIKMSEIFKLPMVCECGDGFIYSRDLRRSIQFDDSDVYMMDHKKAVAHAINNHDRLTEENTELRAMLQHVMKCAATQDNELIDAEEIKKLLNK